MKKITLKIDYSSFLNNDFKKYINDLKGVKSLELDNQNEKICIEYDSSIIHLNVLKMEILLYLDLKKIPSITAFDKHDISNLNKYTINKELSGITLEEYLKNKLEISARNRQKLFHSSGVLINGKKAFSKRILKENDIVSVKVQRDKDYGVIPEKGEVEILYEDDYVIALNKPAGILVHPAGQTTKGTLANYLAGYFQEKKQS